MSEFWRMTPWQLRICYQGARKKAEAEHSNRVGVAWYIAALQRAKTLPKLKDLLTTKKEPSKKINEADILARMQAYQAQREAGLHE